MKKVNQFWSYQNRCRLPTRRSVPKAVRVQESHHPFRPLWGVLSLPNWRSLIDEMFEDQRQHCRLFGVMQTSSLPWHSNHRRLQEDWRALHLQNLRKQPTFRDATASFPRNNECRNSKLTTRHYLDLGSIVLLVGHAAWETCFNQSEALPRSG